MVNVVAKVETTVYNVMLSTMDNLVIPRMKLAIRSADISRTRNPSNVVLDPDLKDISLNVNGLQIIASSRNNSNTILNRIDGTVEAGDYPVSETTFDRETRIHHIHIVIFLMFQKFQLWSYTCLDELSFYIIKRVTFFCKICMFDVVRQFRHINFRKGRISRSLSGNYSFPHSIC